MPSPRDLKDRAQRHPEKAHRADAPLLRKPDWIRVKAPTSEGYRRTREIMRANGLVTVCEEAGCPNVGECWSQGHATMMIMGDICTRGCTFCNVATGRPDALDVFEPGRVAVAVEKLGLNHVVITSVDRDDLEDGGAEHIAQTIRAVRRKTPATTIEVLTPDFLRCPASALEAVVEDMRRKGFKAEPRKSLAMPQQRKIAAMWAELYREGAVKDGSPRALDRFVKRVAGVDSVRFLVPGDANKVIEALKAWQGRIGQGRDRSGRASG